MLQKGFATDMTEAGCDEAGRGCLAGPVFAAAVILPAGYEHPLLNDSKMMSVTERNKMRVEIEQNALAWSVAYADNFEIDEINILQASVLAMHRALAGLKLKPGHILVDGNYFLPWEEVPHKCIIKGDGMYSSIAAASVLAKTYRDEMMVKLHEEFPVYGWAKNKGYATRLHVDALLEHGPCRLHRKSFRLRSAQLSLNFQDGSESLN